MYNPKDNASFWHAPVSLLLTLVFGLWLVGCTKNNTETSASSPKTVESSTSTPASDSIDQSSNISSDYPECDSDEAIEGLKDTFNNSQYALTENLIAVHIEDIKPITDKGTTRKCTANILLNNGGSTRYKFEFKKLDGSEDVMIYGEPI